jgi:phosphohistidine phosphatase
MKTLYILRHAKSSWDYPDLSDHDRPLIEKGKKRTKKIIDFLKANSVSLDFIISSTARRAAETAEYVAKGCNYPADEIKYDPTLYHANSEGIFKQFLDLSDDFQSVMLIGHNPAFTNFVNHFLQPPIDWLPTSGVVCLQFETNKWEHIKEAPFVVGFVTFPKLI